MIDYGRKVRVCINIVISSVERRVGLWWNRTGGDVWGLVDHLYDVLREGLYLALSKIG